MTQDEIRRLLAEQSTTLVKAMVATNEPIEKRLDAVNAHLRELNGKVADHAVALGKGGVRMDGFETVIDDLKSDRRGGSVRREEDREHAKGEDRRLTMLHLYIFIGAVVATVSVLKLFGRLVP